MKHPLKISLTALTAIAVICGCAIYSLHPFCRQSSLIAVPEQFLGSWQDEDSVLQINGDGTGEYRQIIDQRQVVTRYKIRCFRLDQTFYFDVTMADPDEFNKGIGAAAFQLLPTHNLYKLEAFGDKLNLYWPNPEKLTKAAEANALTLPHIIVKTDNDDSVVVFTAKPEEWEAFLQTSSNLIFANDPVLFERQK